jgi:hypothetical protein
MKFASFVALSSILASTNAFGPKASASSAPSLTRVGLTPPRKVEDLGETAKDFYDKNVQTTYG